MITIDFNGNAVSFDMYNLLWWLIVGLIAGLLASLITRRGGSILGDIVLGIIGAFVGGFVLSLLGLYTYGLLGTIFAATIGAVLLILVIRAFTGRRARSY
jgi:uncharacterized membrane protein YeaQ/YmgE (transglycosylase-associated protein family)